MNGDWLENKLNDRLQNFESDFNGEEAWEAFSVRRNSKKRKRWAILWWCGLGVLVLIGVAAIFIEKNKENLVIAKPQEEMAGKVIMPLNTESNTVEKGLKGQNYAQKELLKVENVADIQEEHSVPLKRVEKQEKTANLFINNRKKYQINSLPIIPLELIEVFPVSSIKRNVENIYYLSILPFFDLVHNDEFSIIQPKFIQAKYTKNAVGFSIGYGLHFRNLSTTSREHENIVNSRNNEEKTLDTWETAFFYRRKMKKQLFLESGIGYQQSTNQYNDNYSETLPFLIEDHVLRINRFPDGREEVVMGEAMGIETQNTTYSYYQRHRQLNINLLLGREMLFSNDVDCRLSTGVQYGLSSFSNGTSVDNTNIKDFGYKKSGIINGIMRLEIGKSFLGFHEINFSIAGKTTLNNAFKDSFQKEKRYYLMGNVAYLRRF